MTEHLPECLLLRNGDPRRWLCICHYLRAAEMRGVDAQLAIDLDVAREDVWNEAITAAREAVEVLLKEWWEIFEGKPEDLKELKSMVELNRAIAAIDALKEEQ
jgi:hypothetical protein